MPDSGIEDFPEIFSAVLAQIINFDQVRVFSGHLLAFNNNFLILFLIDTQEEIVIPRRKTWWVFTVGIFLGLKKKIIARQLNITCLWMRLERGCTKTSLALLPTTRDLFFPLGEDKLFILVMINTSLECVQQRWKAKIGLLSS